MIDDKAIHRLRDSAATRQAILDAARNAFTEGGYAAVGVREIAAKAGVTAALINRYFGTKDQLLREVMFKSDAGFASLLGDDRANFGRNFARKLLDHCRTPQDFNPTVLFLRSLGDTDAKRIFVSQVESWIEPLTAGLGEPHARVRAEMIISTIAGFQIFFRVARTTGLNEASDDVLIELLGGTLQRYVDIGRADHS